jgi:hypothetical protein
MAEKLKKAMRFNHPVGNHEKVIYIIAGISCVILLFWCLIFPLALLLKDRKDFLEFVRQVPGIAGSIGIPNIVAVVLSSGRSYLERRFGFKMDNPGPPGGEG